MKKIREYIIISIGLQYSAVVTVVTQLTTTREVIDSNIDKWQSVYK